MRPTLFEIFGEPVPAYFTFLVLGIAAATFIAARSAKRLGLQHATIVDLGLIALLAGVAGARVLHVLVDGYFMDYVHLCTDPSLVLWRITEAQCGDAEGVWSASEGVCRPAGRDCFAWAAFWRGGLTYYGGLLGAGVAGIWLLRRDHFPVGKGVDLVGMAMPLGLFSGRLGCFLGGCCFGSTVHADFPLAARFPAWSPASEAQWRAGQLAAPHLPALPVHAAQLYEAFLCLVVYAILLVFHGRKRRDGEVFLAFLALYAVLRFVVEWFRADDRGGFMALSTSQWIGVGVVIGCGVAHAALRRRDGAQSS